VLSGRRIKLFKLLGFQVQIEWTWLFLAAWMTWSLASDVFPASIRGLESSSYWWMGSAGALGLFASIVFHELWIGTLLGNLLLAVGTILLFLGSLVNGVWMIVVGLYLRSVSRQSYRQLSIRLALAGERVERFLIPDPVTVPPDLPLAELLEEYVYKHHQKTFPVVDGLRLVGCVHARALETVPQSQWTQRRVIDLTQTCDTEDIIPGGVDAMQALTQMSRAGRGRLMVVDGERLVGIITLQDLLEFLALRLGWLPGIRWG